MTPFDHDLDRIRRCLQTEADFATVATLFHDGLGNSHEFHDYCHTAGKGACEKLNRLIESCLAHLFKRKVRLDPFMLLRCPKTDFFHGGAMLGASMVVYFYFDDIDKGMIIVSPSPIDGRTAFLRMSAFALPADTPFVRIKGST